MLTILYILTAISTVTTIAYIAYVIGKARGYMLGYRDGYHTKKQDETLEWQFRELRMN